MFAVVILALLGLVNSAVIEKRALQPMSSYQLQGMFVGPLLYEYYIIAQGLTSE